MCYIGSSIPRCTLMDSKKKGRLYEESLIGTIRNDEASAHSPITNTASMAVRTKRRRKGSRGRATRE